MASYYLNTRAGADKEVLISAEAGNEVKLSALSIDRNSKPDTGSWQG
jgi:hypothetical protein